MAGPQSRLGRFDLPIQAPEFPWDLALSMNRIQGVEAFQVVGHNPSVGASTETVWQFGGVYPNVTTTETISIVSDSAEDVGGSTGVSAVVVTGLDDDGLEIAEIVPLAGLTPAVTQQSFSFVHGVTAATSGSALTNVGNLTATNSTSSQVLAYVKAVTGIDHQLIWRVPANKHLVVSQMTLAVSVNDVIRFDLEVRTPGGPWLALVQVEIAETTVAVPALPGVPVGPLQEVRASVMRTAGGGTSAVTALMFGYMFEEKYFNAS